MSEENNKRYSIWGEFDEDSTSAIQQIQEKVNLSLEGPLFKTHLTLSGFFNINSLILEDIERFSLKQNKILMETHSYGMQSFIFKCLEKGESIDAGDFLPSHYTLVHYVSDCKKSDLFFHPAKQLARSYDPTNVSEWIWDSGLYVNAGDVLIYPSYIETASPKNDLTDPRMTITIPIVLTPNEQG